MELTRSVPCLMAVERTSAYPNRCFKADRRFSTYARHLSALPRRLNERLLSYDRRPKADMPLSTLGDTSSSCSGVC
jgi:hypothetical protein